MKTFLKLEGKKINILSNKNLLFLTGFSFEDFLRTSDNKSPLNPYSIIKEGSPFHSVSNNSETETRDVGVGLNSVLRAGGTWTHFQNRIRLSG